MTAKVGCGFERFIVSAEPTYRLAIRDVRADMTAYLQTSLKH